jgi:hypothetical protein
MRKVLEQCPSCGNPLIVTEMTCPRCQTVVRSQYDLCPFCNLTAEQTVFVKLFVQNRGNLRDMEKALGVSYPTVRGKLEEVAARLGGSPLPSGGVSSASPAPAEAENERRQVLRLIAEGKLTPQEGLAWLRGDEPAAAVHHSDSGH